MKMKAILAMLAGMMVASTAHAATITYTLLKDVNAAGAASPLSYVVIGSVNTGDNSGIAAFNFSLAGVNAAITNRSPQAVFNNDDPEGAPPQFFRGFTLTRLNSAASTAAAQDTPTYATNITGGSPQSVGIIYGVGQTAGNMATPAPVGFTISTPAASGAYLANVVLASGTYPTGGSPLLTVGTGNVFNTTQNGTTQAALINLVNPGGVPEPTSLALLGLGGVSLLARRRKAVTA